jgi:predicted nuclease with TOPRIM domain
MKDSCVTPQSSSVSIAGVLLDRLQSLETKYLEFVGYCSTVLKEHEAMPTTPAQKGLLEGLGQAILKAKMTPAEASLDSLESGRTLHELSEERYRIEQELTYVMAVQQDLLHGSYPDRLKRFAHDLTELCARQTFRSFDRDKLELMKSQIEELFKRHCKADSRLDIVEDCSRMFRSLRDKKEVVSSLHSEKLRQYKAKAKELHASDRQHLNAVSSENTSLKSDLKALKKKCTRTAAQLKVSEESLLETQLKLQKAEALLEELTRTKRPSRLSSPRSTEVRPESVFVFSDKGLKSPTLRLTSRTPNLQISSPMTKSSSALQSRGSSSPLTSLNIMKLDYIELQEQLYEVSKERDIYKAWRADYKDKVEECNATIKKLQQSQSTEKKQLERVISKLQTRLREVSEKVQGLTSSAQAMFYSSSPEGQFFEADRVQLEELVRGLDNLKPKIEISPGASQISTPTRLREQAKLQSLDEKRVSWTSDGRRATVRKSLATDKRSTPSFEQERSAALSYEGIPQLSEGLEASEATRTEADLLRLANMKLTDENQRLRAKLADEGPVSVAVTLEPNASDSSWHNYELVLSELTSQVAGLQEELRAKQRELEACSEQILETKKLFSQETQELLTKTEDHWRDLIRSIEDREMRLKAEVHSGFNRHIKSLLMLGQEASAARRVTAEMHAREDELQTEISTLQSQLAKTKADSLAHDGELQAEISGLRQRAALARSNLQSREKELLAECSALKSLVEDKLQIQHASAQDIEALQRNLATAKYTSEQREQELIRELQRLKTEKSELQGSHQGELRVVKQELEKSEISLSRLKTEHSVYKTLARTQLKGVKESAEQLKRALGSLTQSISQEADEVRSFIEVAYSQFEDLKEAEIYEKHRLPTLGSGCSDALEGEVIEFAEFSVEEVDDFSKRISELESELEARRAQITDLELQLIDKQRLELSLVACRAHQEELQAVKAELKKTEERLTSLSEQDFSQQRKYEDILASLSNQLDEKTREIEVLKTANYSQELRLGHLKDRLEDDQDSSLYVDETAAALDYLCNQLGLDQVSTLQALANVIENQRLRQQEALEKANEVIGLCQEEMKSLKDAAKSPEKGERRSRRVLSVDTQALLSVETSPPNAEMENYRIIISHLTTQLKAVRTSSATHQAQIEQLTETNAQLQEERQKLKVHCNSLEDQLAIAIKTTQTSDKKEVDKIIRENIGLERQITTFEHHFENLLSKNKVLEDINQLATERLNALQIENRELSNKSANSLMQANAKIVDYDRAQKTLKAELKQRTTELDEYKGNKLSLVTNLKALEHDNQRLKKYADAAQAKVAKAEEDKAELQRTVAQMEQQLQQHRISANVSFMNPRDPGLNSSNASFIEALEVMSNEPIVCKIVEFEGSTWSLLKLNDKLIWKLTEDQGAQMELSDSSIDF